MIFEYHVFGARPAALQFVDRVNTKLGYPSPNGTLTYADAEERIDGKWCVLVKRDMTVGVNGGGSTKETFERRTQMKSEVDAPTVQVAAQAQGKVK